LDEIGRGTSTYDGLSIAWAIVEALSDRRSLVLFATHYHELTALDQKPGIFNLTMDVREIDGKIHFLRKVREGAADRSYGIHVAELAGIPESVLRRAKEKLFELESRPGKKAKSVRLKPAETEPGLF
ncbi:MAG TPA: DNA mismatch repair protein MutS, partial [Leptospiraceae bacterium]|nr:DNA mismatch repair protein MutS [Leptospiraceae bacterium]